MNANGGDGLSVFLVEDHSLLRGVLKEYIGIMPGVAKCVTAANAESALGRLGDEALIGLAAAIGLLWPGTNRPALSWT